MSYWRGYQKSGEVFQMSFEMREPCFRSTDALMKSTMDPLLLGMRLALGRYLCTLYHVCDASRASRFLPVAFDFALVAEVTGLLA